MIGLESALIDAGLLVVERFPSGTAVSVAQHEGEIVLRGQRYHVRYLGHNSPGMTNEDANDPYFEKGSRWKLTKVD